MTMSPLDFVAEISILLGQICRANNRRHDPVYTGAGVSILLGQSCRANNCRHDPVHRGHGLEYSKWRLRTLTLVVKFAHVKPLFCTLFVYWTVC